jgi:hypothetical protein
MSFDKFTFRNSDFDKKKTVHFKKCHSLDVELVLSDGDAVDELQRGPEPVELVALVDVDDAVGGGLAVPHAVVLKLFLFKSV